MVGTAGSTTTQHLHTISIRTTFDQNEFGLHSGIILGHITASLIRVCVCLTYVLDINPSQYLLMLRASVIGGLGVSVYN